MFRYKCAVHGNTRPEQEATSSKFLLRAQQILLHKNGHGHNALDGRRTIWNNILSEKARQRTSSPVRAIANALAQTERRFPAEPNRSAQDPASSQRYSTPAAGSFRGLPWGVWLDGSPSDKLKMVQRHLQEEEEFFFPKRDKHFHQPMTPAELNTLWSDAKDEQAKLPFAAGSSLSDTECQKLERVIANHEDHARISPSRKDAFLKANMSQYSSANALRKQMHYEEQKMDRLDHCRKTYEDFRWQHKKKVSSFRQDAINVIGRLCQYNPKSAGFPTSVTFDVMEDFKAKLHHRKFSTDDELVKYMRQINILHKKERSQLKNIRRSSMGVDKSFKRKCSPKSATLPEKSSAELFLCKKASTKGNSVGFALRGCPSSVRREMAHILKDRRMKKPHIWKTRNWFTQSASITCVQCGRQKRSSTDRNIIPVYWITFLTRTGRLCDGCAPMRFIKPSQQKRRRNVALPFVKHEATVLRSWKRRDEKIYAKKYMDLVTLQIGLKGAAINITQNSDAAKRKRALDSILDFDGYNSTPHAKANRK